MLRSNYSPELSSYFALRHALGILCLCFPFALIFGGQITIGEVLPSISDYYFSPMRDLVVGALVAFGIFLVAIREEPRNTRLQSQNFLGIAAGLGAIGVAIFPNRPHSVGIETFMHAIMDDRICTVLHFISALVFLYTLSLYCLKRFPQRASDRERYIHLACGNAILAAGLLATLASFARLFHWPGAATLVEDWNAIFWLESIGVWAFCLSWLVKGRSVQHTNARLI